MGLSAGALKLAGFLMAHGLWSISEQSAADVYVPQALCETASGERRLITFDAATQEQSLEDARSFMGSTAGQFAECAISRKSEVGLGDGQSTSALVIELSSAGQEVTVLQAFSPASGENGFRLLGDELLLDPRGTPLPRGDANAAIVSLREGAADHPGTARNWASWNTDRDPVSPLEM